MLDILGYAYLHGPQSRPRLPLEASVAGKMFPKLADHDPAFISIGMLMIFPSLVKFTTKSSAWVEVEVMVKGLVQVRTINSYDGELY